MTNNPAFAEKIINAFKESGEQKVIHKGEFLLKEGGSETFTWWKQMRSGIFIYPALKNIFSASGMKVLLSIHFQAERVLLSAGSMQLKADRAEVVHVQ